MGIDHNVDRFRMVFRKQIDTTALYRVIPCYYGWLAALIEVDGNVYPCCRCYDPLGNVYEADFREIWYGDRYRRFRKEAVQISVRHTPVSGCDCYGCSHYAANLRVYRFLHPVKGRSKRFDRICPGGS